MPDLRFGDFTQQLAALGQALRLADFPPAEWSGVALGGRELNRALSDRANRPTDEVWAQIYDDYQIHHVRALPTAMGSQAVELFARFAAAPDPLGWIPLQVIGYGLVLGHFLPNYPKPAIPDCFCTHVLLEVSDYTSLQAKFGGINFANMQRALPSLLPEESRTLHEAGPRTVLPFIPRLFPQDTKIAKVLQEMAQTTHEVDWDWVAQRLDGAEALWCRSLRHRPNTALLELINVKGPRLGVADPTTLFLSRDELQFGPLKAATKDWALESKVIPVFVRGEIVVLGSPLADRESVRSTVVSALIGSRVFFCLISEESFAAMAPCWYETPAEAKGTVSDGEPILPYDGKVAISVTETSAASDPNWTTSFVRQFMAQAIDRGASDVHVEPYGDHFRIRFRIDGVLSEPYERFPGLFCPFVVRRIKALANMDISNTREGMDGRFKLTYRGRPVDLRVATLPVCSNLSSDQETCVIRILDAHSAPKKLEEVFFDDSQCTTLRRTLNSTGLILMTGPTGCGKSTTLYAVISEVNSPTKKIMTIEDPVERKILGVNQTAIIAPNTFAKSLRTALRLDFDIILVGEIRDAETASLALHSSQTGHLVLSTLHTNSAALTVIRLEQLGIKPYDIGSSLNLVTAQRLIRRLCLSCRTRHHTPEDTARELSSRGITSPLLEEGYVYEARGCPYCYGTGYKGRVAIMELMEVGPSIRRLLGQKDADITAEELQGAAKETGFTSLFHSGLLAVARGITDIREVRSELSYSLS